MGGQTVGHGQMWMPIQIEWKIFMSVLDNI